MKRTLRLAPERERLSGVDLLWVLAASVAGMICAAGVFLLLKHVPTWG